MKMIEGRKYLILNGHYSGTVVIYLDEFDPVGKYKYDGLYLSGAKHPHKPYSHFLFGAEEDFPIVDAPEQLIEDFLL